jgi:hypothetical protein
MPPLLLDSDVGVEEFGEFTGGRLATCLLFMSGNGKAKFRLPGSLATLMGIEPMHPP